jgi:hypothetical protein
MTELTEHSARTRRGAIGGARFHRRNWLLACALFALPALLPAQPVVQDSVVSATAPPPSQYQAANSITSDNGFTVNSGSSVTFAAGNFIAVNSLTASYPSFLINSGANVVFAAGSYIKLENGFRAIGGSPGITFHAIAGAASAVTVATAPVNLPLVVDGVACTSPCGFEWVTGSSHTVAATTPVSGAASTQYTFSNWSDGAAIAHTIVATPATFTASYTTLYQQTITSTPLGLTLSVDGTACSTPCSYYWLQGSTHTLSAPATIPITTGASQYSFASWSQGGAAAQTITSGGAASSFTAAFVTQYHVTTVVSPAAGGAVTQSNPTGWYNSGAQATLTATANTGYQFSGYSGSFSSSTNPLTFSVTSAASVTALFTTLTPSPDFSLSVIQSPAVPVGGSGVFVMRVTPLSGFSGAVAYTVSGLPAGASVAFNPSPNPNPPFMVVTTTASTPAGSFNLTLTGTSGSLLHTVPVTLTVQAGGSISGLSQLQQNLGPMPFDIYDYTSLPSASSAGTTFCPAGNGSIRACYQAILANLRAQGVTGVRFQFGICGGPGQSTALNNCGQAQSSVSLNNTWASKVTDFFTDLYNAGIYDITPTPELTDWQGTADYTASHYQPAGPIPSGGTNCSGQSTLHYPPALPYGQVPCTTTAPYYCTTWPNCGEGYCQANAGYPANDAANQTNYGYNCSPANPIFVGWSNIFSAINAMLSAATPHLNVFELDFEQEINLTDFTVQGRVIVDNQSGTYFDVLGGLRALMTSHSFDPARVTSSAAASRPMTAGNNCLSVYQDYARQMSAGAVASAIAGGWIGTPQNATTADGMWCGGTNDPANNPPWMLQMPLGHSLPSIVDLHMYPTVEPSGGVPYVDESAAQVQSEAAIAFGDIPHLLAAIGTPSALFVVGETHSNTTTTVSDNHCPTTSPHSCECHPTDAAFQTVSGFSSSSLAGYSVVFRPWSNLSASCYSASNPNNQQVNPNNNGPYKPTREY